jgi:adenine/guanine phosphoribosyltransferase-like PRPP-binding protein
MTDFTRPTTSFWQTIESDIAPERLRPPFQFDFPARLPDARWLVLPIRRREQTDRAVASFIADHASFEVIDALSSHMTARVRPFAPDTIVGVPTLGLTLAAPLARNIGHHRFVPLGYSRKFWYDETHSVPVRSITASQTGRRLYVDPNLLPQLAGRRVVVVDDTISSGTTAVVALTLMELVGAQVVGLAFAMSQGRHWRGAMGAISPHWIERVSFVFESPHFVLTETGWVPED